MRIALAAFGLALGLVAGDAHAQLLSPGPLVDAHAAIDDDDHCDACHQSGRKVVAERCLVCHDDLARRLSAGAGLHGRAYRGRPCEDCHVEHIGRRARLVRWPGGSMDKLDHALTGWPLEGDHQAVKCLDCHTQKKQGKPTFLGARPACDSCHDDPHDARFGSDCRKCHDLRDWNQFDQKAFDHAKSRYPLTGKHTSVECKGCHGDPPRWKPLSFATCDACHEDVHRGDFAPRPCTDCHTVASWHDAATRMRDDHPWLSLRNGHRRVACEACHDRGNTTPPSRGKQCAGCHRPVHEAPFGKACERCHASIKWLGLPDRIGRDAHERTAYPLAGRHQTVACAGCHPARLPVARRYRELTYDRCGACHADRHAGEFAARDGGECGACHTVDGYTPTRFGIDAHATTAFALDGKHVATPCKGCHGDARPRLDLKVVKQTCAECHADPHGGQFVREMADGGCAHCHTTARWQDARVDHSTWPLTGVHGRTACAACHGDATDPRQPATYRGVPRECEGCHDDVHGGQFRLTAPVKACSACHATDGFALPGFDHAGQSGYALQGKHAAVTCADCHPQTELRNAARAVRYRLGYRACDDCHANPHTDLFDDLACSGCHSVAGWKVASMTGATGFDHDRTGFPLRGAHVQRTCGDCHTGTTRPATTCEGCHRDPHAGRVDGACQECHTASAWSDTGALERHRRTRMPLTGRHAQLDCVACHARTERTWSSPPVACWGCHAGDYGDPATHPDHDGDPADPLRAPFSRDCGRCHRTSGWNPALFDPTALSRQRVAPAHDTWFVLSSGKHRDAACDSCHVDRRRPARVRCDGCHRDGELAAQHDRRPARSAAACLRCHPRGQAR